MKITHHVTVVSPGHSSTESLMAPVSLPYVPGIFDTPDDARHVRVENRTREVRPVIVRTVPARPVDEDACRKKLAELARAENAAMRRAFGNTYWNSTTIAAKAQAAALKGSQAARALGEEIRREILEMIASGPMTTKAIAERMDKTGEAISHHIAVLVSDGSVVCTGKAEQQRKLWGRV